MGTFLQLSLFQPYLLRKNAHFRKYLFGIFNNNIFFSFGIKFLLNTQTRQFFLEIGTHDELLEIAPALLGN